MWVLLEVERPVKLYMCFFSEWARLHLGIDATSGDCKLNAAVMGQGAFPTVALLDLITR